MSNSAKAYVTTRFVVPRPRLPGVTGTLGDVTIPRLPSPCLHVIVTAAVYWGGYYCPTSLVPPANAKDKLKVTGPVCLVPLANQNLPPSLEDFVPLKVL